MRRMTTFKQEPIQVYLSEFYDEETDECKIDLSEYENCVLLISKDIQNVRVILNENNAKLMIWIPNLQAGGSDGDPCMTNEGWYSSLEWSSGYLSTSLVCYIGPGLDAVSYQYEY